VMRASMKILSGAVIVLVIAGCGDQKSTPNPSGASNKTPAAAVATPSPIQPFAQGAFNAVGAMVTARADFTATRLNDGRVLVAGGLDASGKATAKAELYDPATRTFAPTGSLKQARVGDTATRLADGRVLFTGGADETGVAKNSAEFYDQIGRAHV
jgi:hypothetical protein